MNCKTYLFAVIPALVWGCMVVQEKPADSAPPAEAPPPPPPAAEPAPAPAQTAATADAGAPEPAPAKPKIRDLPKPDRDAGTQPDAAATDAGAAASGS